MQAINDGMTVVCFPTMNEQGKTHYKWFVDGSLMLSSHRREQSLAMMRTLKNGGFKFSSGGIVHNRRPMSLFEFSNAQVGRIAQRLTKLGHTTLADKLYYHIADHPESFEP